MNIASLNLAVTLRALAFAAALNQLACSDAPLESGTLPAKEHDTEPPATAPEQVRSPSEADDDRVATVADAAVPVSRPKPVDASSGATVVEREPPPTLADAGPSVAIVNVQDAAANVSTDAQVKAVPDAGAEADIIDEAFMALSSGRKDKIPKLITALDERVKQHPDDGMATFYAGAMRFWKLTEGTDGVVSLIQNLSLPEEIVERFGKAYKLVPNDFRIPGFFGLMQTDIGYLTGDAALTKAGLQTLDEAIARYPAYGYFLRASATAAAPVDDPLFATTMSDMAGIFEECLIERSDGEVTYTYPRGPKLAERPHICLNDSIIPHVWEGTLISFADMALKAGWGAEKVRALYRSVRTAPNYAEWPFASKLEARIEAAEEHARLYADDNPLNDPTSWGLEGNLCSGCHQER